jgi:hypothetical protein
MNLSWSNLLAELHNESIYEIYIIITIKLSKFLSCKKNFWRHKLKANFKFDINIFKFGIYYIY